MVARSVLTLNTGSSSVKAARYLFEPEQSLDVTAGISRIGLPSAELRIKWSTGDEQVTQLGDAVDQGNAVRQLLEALRGEGPHDPDAIGHRVVHGGARHGGPEVLSENLIESLRGLVPLAPEHLPQAIAAMEATRREYSEVPQVACFDTAFHRTMPPVAKRYPLPRWIEEQGIVRYGFHGLSYESIMAQLIEVDPMAAQERLIIAHLGNGASAVAVNEGRSVDTTMGFTPTGGLMMGTRSGDLDPGVLVHLLRSQGVSAEQLSDLVSEQSGLLGVSGWTSDMAALLRREADDPRARGAIELFCYQARKHIGALIAVLGGIRTLVFTGGIGEHAAPVRARICAELGFVGISIDPDRNVADSAVVSPDASPVTVRVMPAEEDRMIARHTFTLLSQLGAFHV